MTSMITRYTSIALRLLMCWLLLSIVSTCHAACTAGGCPTKKYCNKGKCVNKQPLLTACSRAEQCLSGICFKKTCREVKDSLKFRVVSRTDATWLALQKGFQNAGGIEYKSFYCPNADSRNTGIVDRIELQDMSCCYKAPYYGCLPAGQGISQIKVSCWAIDPKTTLPVRGGAVAKVSVPNNPLKGAPCTPAPNMVTANVGTRRYSSGFSGNVAGFTEMWLADHMTGIVGAWPHERCTSPKTCPKTLPPGGVSTLKCPDKMAISGLQVAVLKGKAGERFTAVVEIFCGDPLGYLLP